MKPLLTQGEIEIYWQRGYHLYHQQVMAANKLAGLTELFEQLHAMPVADMQAKYAASPFDIGMDERNLAGLNQCHLWEPRLLQWLLDDEVLDLAENIVGPNIGLFSSHFICKEPGDDVITPWHDDRFYWQPLIEPMDKIVTVWLAIDDSTLENGCMQVIPGTHFNDPNYELEDYDGEKSLFSKGISEDMINESHAVPLEIERGQCSLHDARIIHGAKGNKSRKRRCSYTMRYFSTELKLMMPVKQHPTWLARGKDIAGNSYVNR